MSTSRRCHVLVGATAILALLLAACGLVGGARTAEAAGRVALIQSSDVGGGDAAFVGTLGVNEKGCLGLAGSDGSFYVVIWPHSATLDDDGNLRDDRGQAIELGDEVHAGGGEEPFVENYPERAKLCLPDPTDEDTVAVVLQNFGN